MVLLKLFVKFKAFRKRPAKPGEDVGYFQRPRRRGEPAVIEVDTMEAQECQEDTLGHELGHWIWSLFFPFVEDGDAEEAFAQEVGRAIARIVRKFRRRR